MTWSGYSELLRFAGFIALIGAVLFLSIKRVRKAEKRLKTCQTDNEQYRIIERYPSYKEWQTKQKEVS